MHVSFLSWTLGNIRNLLVPGSSSASSSWQKPKEKTIGKKRKKRLLLVNYSKVIPYENANIICKKKKKKNPVSEVKFGFKPLLYNIYLLYSPLWPSITSSLNLKIKKKDRNRTYHRVVMRIKWDINIKCLFSTVFVTSNCGDSYLYPTTDRSRSWQWIDRYYSGISGNSLSSSFSTGMGQIPDLSSSKE